MQHSRSLLCETSKCSHCTLLLKMIGLVAGLGHFIVITLSLLTRATATDKQPTTDKEICAAILQSTTSINSAQKTFTYQCRPGDDCGGAADRLAGIMSGIFFALLSERAFRIHWPGFDHVFEPQTIKWQFDENTYGIPPDELKHNGFITKTWGAGTITTPFSNQLRGALFNDLNTGEINNPKNWPRMATFEHLFYHSNRDPDPNGLYKRVAEKYHWPEGDGDLTHNYYIAYRCIFNDIFTPSAAFLNTTYKPLTMPEMPFSELVTIVEDLDHVSLAYHYRIPDKFLATDPPEVRISDHELAWLASFGEQHKSESTQKMNLFFISNSVNSALKLINHPSMHAAYNKVYAQELTGARHINEKNPNSAPSSHSLKQAMMDWWVMRQAHYLVCGQSGFCRIAGTVSSEEQVKIDQVKKTVIPHSYRVCTNRDCER